MVGVSSGGTDMVVVAKVVAEEWYRVLIQCLSLIYILRQKNNSRPIRACFVWHFKTKPQLKRVQRGFGGRNFVWLPTIKMNCAP